MHLKSLYKKPNPTKYIFFEVKSRTSENFWILDIWKCHLKWHFRGLETTVTTLNIKKQSPNFETHSKHRFSQLEKWFQDIFRTLPFSLEKCPEMQWNVWRSKWKKLNCRTMGNYALKSLKNHSFKYPKQ